MAVVRASTVAAVLLISILAAASTTIVQGEPSACSIDPANCCDTRNRDKYARDQQSWSDTNGNGARDTLETGNNMTLTCTLPSKMCNCSSQVWKVGPWKMNSVPNGYLNQTQGQAQQKTNPQPYIGGISTRENCCKLCSAGNTNLSNPTPKQFACAYWMHFVPASNDVGTVGGCSGSSSCGYCIIFPPGGPIPECADSAAVCPGDDSYKYPWKATNYATVGKGCPGGKNDPHFVGAMGTHFDFNGIPDQSFCLVTDPVFQINMRMRGYYDSRTIGASVLSDGRAVRTWIKDLGVLWVDPVTQAVHTLKLSARDGKEHDRNLGYMGSITLDGSVLPRMSVGEKVTGPAGLVVTFVGYEKEGGGFFDVDVYDVTIPGMISLEVKLRVAHPLLQTADDAMTHINVRFMHLEHTPKTHGVLGQTFREGRSKRTMDYHSLSALMGRDIPADSDIAKGFLDGNAADYRTPDVLSSACMFSAFNGQELPATI